MRMTDFRERKLKLGSWTESLNSWGETQRLSSIWAS